MVRDDLADFLASLDVGTKVIVDLKDGRHIEGLFVSAEPSTLVVEPAGPIPLSEVESVALRFSSEGAE
jgi:hypothetical protein